jgi:hypothetical protein
MSCTIPCCRLKPTSPPSQIIAEQPGLVMRPGHSYGGAVITSAANHEKPAALGYIAAFVPDACRGSRCDRSRGRPDKVLSADVDRL